MKKCGCCGFENEDDALFCGECGAKLEKEKTVLPPVPPKVHVEEEDDFGFVLSDEDEEVEEIEPVNEDAAPKKKSHVGIVVAIVLAVAVLGGGAGAFMAIQNSKHQEQVAALEKEKEEKVAAAKKEADKAKEEAEKAKEEAKAAKERAKSNTSKTEEKDTTEDSNVTEGTYTANYNMKERDAASLDASQVGHIKKGDVLDITEVTKNEDGSYWGKLSNGHYVCIQDSEYNYLSK